MWLTSLKSLGFISPQVLSHQAEPQFRGRKDSLRHHFDLPGNCRNCKVPHNSGLFTIAQLSKIKQRLSSAHLVSAVDRFVEWPAGGLSNGSPAQPAPYSVFACRQKGSTNSASRSESSACAWKANASIPRPHQTICRPGSTQARGARPWGGSLCGKTRRTLPAGGGIASFRGSITHSAYPLATLGCVPRGSGERLEAERMAPRSPQEGKIDFCIFLYIKVGHWVAAHL